MEGIVKVKNPSYVLKGIVVQMPIMYAQQVGVQRVVKNVLQVNVLHLVVLGSR